MIQSMGNMGSLVALIRSSQHRRGQRLFRKPRSTYHEDLKIDPGLWVCLRPMAASVVVFEEFVLPRLIQVVLKAVTYTDDIQNIRV